MNVTSHPINTFLADTPITTNCPSDRKCIHFRKHRHIFDFVGLSNTILFETEVN